MAINIFQLIIIHSVHRGKENVLMVNCSIQNIKLCLFRTYSGTVNLMRSCQREMPLKSEQRVIAGETKCQNSDKPCSTRLEIVPQIFYKYGRHAVSTS